MADEPFEGWAIVELMGHRRLAGYVREVELAGAGMLRLDVPRHAAAVCTCGSNDPGSASHEDHQLDCMLFAQDEVAPLDVDATQFYSPAALYCLTPTTEAIARAIVSKPTPVQRWELERAPEPDMLDPPDEHSDAEWAELEAEEM
jgi:hypothetical protein